jgi:hypothetical protein
MVRVSAFSGHGGIRHAPKTLDVIDVSYCGAAAYPELGVTRKSPAKEQTGAFDSKQSRSAVPKLHSPHSADGAKGGWRYRGSPAKRRTSLRLPA